MANTLAYYDMAKVTAVKCFIVQALGFESCHWRQGERKQRKKVLDKANNYYESTPESENVEVTCGRCKWVRRKQKDKGDRGNNTKREKGRENDKKRKRGAEIEEMGTKN